MEKEGTEDDTLVSFGGGTGEGQWLLKEFTSMLYCLSFA